MSRKTNKTWLPFEPPRVIRQTDNFSGRAYEKLSISSVEKNWLFCGNHDSAENAAIIYSMLGCCKACGVNFRVWLIYFLNNIHNYDNDYSMDLADLLPHNFAKNTSKTTTSIS